MDGLRKPVGDQPPRVYWFRRVLVLVIAAVVVIALVFVIGSMMGGGDQAEAPEAEASLSPAASVATAPDPSRPCVSDDITLGVEATPATVPQGATPGFTVSIEDTGDSPCTLTTAAEGTELAIRSGDQQYYSSTWCDADPGFGDATWILDTGDRKTVDLTWSGARYDESCTEIADWAPGSYWVAVAIAGIPADEVQFQLAG